MGRKEIVEGVSIDSAVWNSVVVFNAGGCFSPTTVTVGRRIQRKQGWVSQPVILLCSQHSKVGESRRVAEGVVWAFVHGIARRPSCTLLQPVIGPSSALHVGRCEGCQLSTCQFSGHWESLPQSFPALFMSWLSPARCCPCSVPFLQQAGALLH